MPTAQGMVICRRSLCTAGALQDAESWQISKRALNEIVATAAVRSAKSLEGRPALGNCQFVPGRSAQPG